MRPRATIWKLLAQFVLGSLLVGFGLYGYKGIDSDFPFWLSLLIGSVFTGVCVLIRAVSERWHRP